MNFLTKVKLIILFTFLALSIVNGQDSKRSWFIVQDSHDKVVYVDTSNIELTDNQLFVRNIIMYRQPVFMHTIQQNVKKSKSHLLFDTEQNTYSVIGAIFYDVKGEIIGESNDVGVTSGAANYSLKIQKGSVYDIIKNKALEYLTTNRITPEPSNYLVQKSEEIIAKVDSVEKEENRKQEIPKITKPKEPKIVAKVELPKPKLPKPPIVKEEATKKRVEEKPAEIKYNTDNERAVKGLIYTDGSTFCFQVSSWKREKIAKQEVERIKKKGYDAFYVEAEIPNRGTWYRVRVGYFKSLDEAEKFQKVVK
jgi:cell division septation protein DedD